MNIYPPLKKASFFGWYHELRSIGDFEKCIVQRFGERPEVYGLKGHNGIDLPCIVGTPILATHDGEASAYEERCVDNNYRGYGKYVSIRNRASGFKTEYCHLSEFIKTGQVKAGEVIGLSGNTGFSDGPHLHFTLKITEAVDPLPHFFWFDTMTEKEVAQLQALEGYKDEVGVAFWTGKPLSAYLTARLEDKIKQIESINGN